MFSLRRRRLSTILMAQSRPCGSVPMRTLEKLPEPIAFPTLYLPMYTSVEDDEGIANNLTL